MADLVSPSRSHGLVEILDRVLDKGLVVAGDIKINLANVELLTVQIRLLICSIDKAEQIGMNWWRYDPRLTAQIPSRGDVAEQRRLDTAVEDRLARIEQALERLAALGDGEEKQAKGSRSGHSRRE